ncbi:MAG: alpha/beta hydrolase [Promethearchaeia archaeon]
MPIAEVNDIKINYEVHGEDNAEPLFLASGWTYKKEMWMAQVDSLSEHFKVITFDNRGCGKSSRPPGPYTMEIFADDLLGLMDFLEIENAHLMGYALGAMYLQVFALKHPKRVNKLILLNTVAAFPDESGVKRVMGMNVNALDFQKNAPKKYFMKSAKMAFHRNFIKELKANPDKRFHDLWSVDEFVKEYNIDPMTPEDVKNQGKAMLGFNILDDITELKPETLIIASSHNRLHPKAAMEAMHEKIPNSKLELLKKAGDSAYLSRAPEVNQLVIDFLKE